MPKFAANLTMLWTELDPIDRFAAAARNGFRHVEMLFPHELDEARLVATLREHQLEMVLFDPAPGNCAGGEGGILCLPGREDAFMGTVQDAIGLAKRLGTKRLNALAGIVPAGISRETATEVAVNNIRAAVPLIEKAGLTLMVESINGVDMPAYLLDTVDEAADLGGAAGSASGRLQLAQHHVATSAGRGTEVLPQYPPRIRHSPSHDRPAPHHPAT